jgi:ribosome-binding protein aMBF1 (putative translation factor)
MNNSKKAEASSNFSSYQMLKTDIDFVVIIRTKEARKKFGLSRKAIAVKLF